ncbi:MAG: hypothetical protein IKU34_11120 [Clostridia bacterium]|nr:hypothetical protein [Clostridia bacterium]
MEHLDRCIFLVFCSIPLTLGIGLMIAGFRRKAQIRKFLGIALTIISALGCNSFAIGLFFSGQLLYLISGILIAIPPAVAIIFLDNALDQSALGGFVRVLLRFFLTVVHLAICVGALMLVGHEQALMGILVALDSAAVLSLFLFMQRFMRAAKLANSPVMKQVRRLYREYNCAAIQLCTDRVRLFDHLPNLYFCRDEDYRSSTMDFQPPEHWQPWFEEGAWRHELRYADLGYPAMSEEQLKLCATGLKRKLSGLRTCHHHSRYLYTPPTHYDEKRGTHVRTTYVTHLYDDQLLYKASAYQSMTRNTQTQKVRRQKAQKTAKAKGNSWE